MDKRRCFLFPFGWIFFSSFVSALHWDGVSHLSLASFLVCTSRRWMDG